MFVEGGKPGKTCSDCDEFAWVLAKSGSSSIFEVDGPTGSIIRELLEISKGMTWLVIKSNNDWSIFNVWKGKVVLWKTTSLEIKKNYLVARLYSF